MNENCIIFEKYTQSRTICEQAAVPKDWAGALGALEGTVLFELGRLKSMVESGVANRTDLNKAIVSLQQGLQKAKDLAPHEQYGASEDPDDRAGEGSPEPTLGHTDALDPIEVNPMLNGYWGKGEY